MEGVAVRCSCALFLESLLGPFYFDFVCFHCKQTGKIAPESGQKSCKNVPGSHAGAPWGAHGAQSASRVKKDIKLDCPPPHLWTISDAVSEGNLEKNHFVFVFLVEAPTTRVVFSRFLVNFGCVFWALVAVVGKFWKR